MNLQTEEEIKKDIRKNVVFYTRGRFAVLEIRFADNDLSAPSVAITLRTEKWVLFPAYLGRRIAKLSMGRVSPDIEAQ